MKREEALEAIVYCGSVYAPKRGEHDLQELVSEVVIGLPHHIRRWLLEKTSHVFVAGSGELGKFFTLSFPAGPIQREIRHGMVHVRIIHLSERLMSKRRKDALFTIAHEIAHSRLNHEIVSKGTAREKENAADALAIRWGFQVPASRQRLLENGHYDEPRTAASGR